MWDIYKHTFDPDICDGLFLYRLAHREAERSSRELKKAIEENQRERGLI